MRSLLLAVGVASLAAELAAAAPVPPELRERAVREGEVRVVVRLAAPSLAGHESPAARAAREAATERVAERALQRIGGPAHTELRRYQALPLLALTVSARELDELAASDGVLALQEDRALLPSLAESIPRVGANITADAGWTGAGSAVVIVDTGVEGSHPFFGGRVVAEACFSSTHDCPAGGTTQLGPGAAVPCTYGSLCWHGTHVAGIAAGANATLHGVAPGASLIAIQVGSRLTGTGCGSYSSPCVVIYDSDAIAALDYVADTLSGAWDVAAVNMSFSSIATWSSDASCDASNPGYELAIDSLASLGIATVAAAGNGAVTTGVASPACVSTAIAVGASADVSEAVWVGSNSGPPLDLFAPGTNITSSVPGGGYATKTGTSMASPHVAGAFAVLRQADPAASVTTLKLALESTGLPITDTRNSLVRPRLQVDDAVRSRAPAACFDGLDNDGDGAIDVDGDGGAPDPQCSSGFDDTEYVPGSCGIGPELAGVLPLLGVLRALRRRAKRG